MTPRERFERAGFLDPVPVLTAAQCALLLRHEEMAQHPAPLDWNKGWAASDPLLAAIGRQPALLRLLRPLLGGDIVLWGASIVRRRPGEVHSWHTDIETSAPEGRFVTAWIGIENTSPQSGLTLVAGSHRLPRTIQEELHRRGLKRGALDDAAVLAIAREIDPAADLVVPPVGDGLAVLFHGRMWHGTRNTRAGAPRSALLLQYAAADTPVHILDSTRLEWPFAFLETPRPPVLAVSGTIDERTNRVVPDPQPEAAALAGGAFPLAMPLPLPTGRSWQPHPTFSGRTPNLPLVTAHASVLAAGHQPHPPHSHLEEEILVVLDGTAELTVAAAEDDPSPRTLRASRGDFAYYPAYQHHTIRNVGDRPLTYFMVKWQGPPAAVERTLPVRFEADPGLGQQVAGGPSLSADLLFEDATHFLGKLHAHRTTILPGGGYAAHADAHDIVIVVLSGRLHTLGLEVGPDTILLHGGGEVHGIGNPGPEPARYLVFEFHTPDAGAAPVVVDREWYLTRYLDVAKAGFDPAWHYVRYGAGEGRLPRPPRHPHAAADAELVDRDWYLARYPDVAAAGIDPADHYRIAGAFEGREPCADYPYRLARQSGLFDEAWYRRRHPDAAGYAGDLLRHHLTGTGEGARSIGPNFDGRRYLDENPDVRAAGMHPLLHYLQHGRREGRAQPTAIGWDPPADLEQRVRRYRARPRRPARRIALCTAIVGGYDTLMVPDRPDPAVDHICFTDGDLDGYGVWDVRRLPFRDADATRVARFAKTHLPQLAADYDAVAWLDGNVVLRGDLAPYVAAVADAGWGLGLIPHPERTCIYAEAEACKALDVDRHSVIDAQMARYRALGVPPEGGLWETNFLVLRPGEPGVAAAFDLWWEEIERHSRRDQLSLGWALALAGVPHGPLPTDGRPVRDHPDFGLYPHSQCRSMTVPDFLLDAALAPA